MFAIRIPKPVKCALAFVLKDPEDPKAGQVNKRISLVETWRAFICANPQWSSKDPAWQYAFDELSDKFTEAEEMGHDTLHPSDEAHAKLLEAIAFVDGNGKNTLPEAFMEPVRRICSCIRHARKLTKEEEAALTNPALAAPSPSNGATAEA